MINRAAPPAGKTTIRSRMIEEILRILREAPFDEDVPDGDKLFDTVKIGSLDDISIRETPGVAIEEGEEQIVEMTGPYTLKSLRMFFNVKTLKVVGVDPDPLINYYFARITKLLVTTTTHFADLADDIGEAGNSIQKVGADDPEPGGSIYLDIDYRHFRGDMHNQ